MLETQGGAGIRISLEQADGERSSVPLPNISLALLSKVLEELGRGRRVEVLATDSEVTTQRAADFLMVSRPYLVKMLDEGKIPFRRVGPRRRILLADLLRYRDQTEAERHRGLDELVAEAQKLGMY